MSFILLVDVLCQVKYKIIQKMNPRLKKSHFSHTYTHGFHVVLDIIVADETQNLLKVNLSLLAFIKCF